MATITETKKGTDRSATALSESEELMPRVKRRRQKSKQKKPRQLLYASVRDGILADLSSGDLKLGQRYFTEDQLIKLHRVSRTTIRRAMAELEEKGYIQRQRGLGSVVSKVPSHDEPQTSADHGGSNGSKNLRLIVLLPKWDDSLEGFYSARILRELTLLAEREHWAIEIRHPQDTLEFAPDPDMAILAMDPDLSATLRLTQLAKQNVRIVVTAPAHAIPAAINICDANSQATSDIVKRFYQLGHRHVGIINHDTQHNDFRQAMAGFINAHADLEKSIHPQAIIQLTMRKDHANDIQINVNQITAWICTFNGAVVSLVDQARHAGRSIPDDISLVCYDHPSTEVIAAVGKRLSVIQPDAHQTAKTVMSCVKNWDDKVRGKMIEIPPRWVEGDTIARGQSATGIEH